MSFSHYTRLGQSGLEVRLQSMTDELRKLRLIPSSTIQVEQTTHGQVVSVRRKGGKSSGTPGTIRRYRVTNVGLDSITCLDIESGQSETLAKPYNLRSTGWNGASITYPIASGDETYPNAPGSITVTYAMVSPTYRTAVRGSGTATTTEHQVILPRYIEGTSIIYGVSVEGGTGVTGVDIIDLNVDGRAWARVV